MLGETCLVNIFGKLNNSDIYTGHILYGKCAGCPVYVVSRKKITEETIGAVVIAFVQCKSSVKSRYLVAPKEDSVFYEPQLNKIFKRLRNFQIDKIKCYYEKSCGALIYTYFNKDLKVLLVKNHNGKCWSFPKGHIENSENEHETAMREIKEETGLDVEFIKDFRETSEYSPFGKTKKIVVFFLARAKTGNVKIQEDEIDAYMWVSIESARRLCVYENDIRLITKAESILKNNNEVDKNSILMQNSK